MNLFKQMLRKLGYSYYARGLYNDALVKMKQGVQNNPNHKLPHLYAGPCYVGLKDKTNAMFMYEKLKTIDAARRKSCWIELIKCEL